MHALCLIGFPVLLGFDFSLRSREMVAGADIFAHWGMHIVGSDHKKDGSLIGMGPIIS